MSIRITRTARFPRPARSLLTVGDATVASPWRTRRNSGRPAGGGEGCGHGFRDGVALSLIAALAVAVSPAASPTANFAANFAASLAGNSAASLATGPTSAPRANAAADISGVATGTAAHAPATLLYAEATTPRGTAKHGVVLIDARHTKKSDEWTIGSTVHRARGRIDLESGFVLIAAERSTPIEPSAADAARIVLCEAVGSRRNAAAIGSALDLVVAESPQGAQIAAAIQRLASRGTVADSTIAALPGAGDAELQNAFGLIEGAFSQASLGSRLRRALRILTYPFATSRGTSGGASSSVVGVWTRPTPGNANEMLVTYAVDSVHGLTTTVPVTYRTASGVRAIKTFPAAGQFVTLRMKRSGSDWIFVDATTPAALSAGPAELRNLLSQAKTASRQMNL
ncbi:MAG: hypothetical protein AB8G96_08295 [Phycisphaerales bacterium]